MNRLLRTSIAFTVLTTSLCARAQTGSDKAAAAQVLFDEAMALLKAGKTQEACPKLAESQRLDPGMATQYRLAECYEETGRIASAWALFVEVADAAKVAKMPDREKVARKRAEALEPRLSRMTIVVPDEVADIEGLEIKRDGEIIGKALWGTAVPVDPGEHTLTASAPGKKTWTGKGSAGEQATRLEVSVPDLEDAPPEPLAAREEVVMVDKPRSKMPAFILGGVAVAAAGVGVTMLVLAEGKKSDVYDLNGQIGAGNCVSTPSDPRCSELTDMAYQVDTFHNVGVGALVGAGATAVAAVAYLVWPQQKVLQKKITTGVDLRATPVVGRNQGGLWVSGSF